MAGRVGVTTGATLGATIGATKIFANLLIISFGVRGVTKLRPSIYARARRDSLGTAETCAAVRRQKSKTHNSSFPPLKPFKDYEFHEFNNEQRFEDLKDSV